MGTHDQPGRKIKTVKTVFDIIEIIDEEEGVTLTEITSCLGMAKSTVHGYLVALLEKECIVREGDEYYLGLEFLNYGTRVKNRREVTRASQSELSNLAEQTGEVAWLVVEEYGYGIFLSQAISDRGVPTHGWIGKRTHLHTTSAGKAILAHLPKEKVEEIIDTHGLPKETEETITDKDELFEELAEIRERGVAFNRSETIHGHRGISAPIIFEGEIVGSAGIAGPAHRLSGETFTEELPQIILGTVNAIELNMEYS